MSSQSRFFQAKNGCANLKVIDGLLNVDPAIPQPTWFQTPSVVEIQAGQSKQFVGDTNNTNDICMVCVVGKVSNIGYRNLG